MGLLASRTSLVQLCFDFILNLLKTKGMVGGCVLDETAEEEREKATCEEALNKRHVSYTYNSKGSSPIGIMNFPCVYLFFCQTS